MINELASAYSYCETLFALKTHQPFNVYSNLAFAVVAILILLRYQELPRGLALVIAVFLLLTGGASAMWHASMEPEALIADLVVSSLFCLAMTFLIIRYIFYWPLWFCALTLVVMGGGALFLRTTHSPWIGQDGLILLLMSILLFGAGTWSALVGKSNSGLYLLMSSFWLAGGFLILSLDHQSCGIFVIGTHFLWHVLAAVVVYCLARALACADIELLDMYDHARNPKLYMQTESDEKTRAEAQDQPSDFTSGQS